MSPKIIEIVVSPNGELTLQTRGFSGPGCQEASKLLESALGTITAQKLTPEFYQTQSQSQALQQKQ